MKKPKVLILRTAGTNCERETASAFEMVGGEPRLVHIRQLRAGHNRITDFDIFVIPGGFSYGDDVAAGRILANEIRRHLPELKTFIRSGRPVLGVCNGFQALVKAGLLPNGRTGEQIASFAANDSNRFEARWTRLRLNIQSHCLFLKDLPEMIELPVAHGEGKFVVKSPKVLEDLKRSNAIALQYVNEEGNLAGYPYNPNGSIFNIAGICNSEGNCLGLMPHPERFVTRYHHPNWTRQTFCKEGIGLEMVRNAVKHVLS
ncbi:MAG: phosphoribosylformylglycinamidine synthase I [Elusimicrobia bacterium]|nr:phosphoribosylformylglycinamidine synthase I [Elusimicrobiota bacterium]